MIICYFISLFCEYPKLKLTFSHLIAVLPTMIIRKITKELIESGREYPVVTILGPRQSGKTTLVKMAFPDKPYYSFENPDIRMAVETDPRGFLNNLPDGAILDEIQKFPQLLSYIQGIVDDTQLKGMFILTGSHQHPNCIRQ